jgi:hypothetical protein
MSILARDTEWPAKTEAILLSTQTEGALTVQRYEYTSDGRHHQNALTFTVVRGADQQMVLSGVPAAETDDYVAQCVRTMSPELVASASRRAKGCASEIRFADALERIVGRNQPEPPMVASEGAMVGWRIEKPDPTSPLARAEMQRSTLTSVCGVSVMEILADRDHICCITSASTSITATFRSADGTAKTMDLPALSQ